MASQYKSDTTDENAPGYSPYPTLDEDAIRESIREEARRNNVEYHESDFGDVARDYYNSGPHGGQGGNIALARQIASRKIQERATNQSQSGASEDGGGGGGYPTPERRTMPQPTQPSVYSVGFTQQLMQRQPQVGETQRNNILTSILNRPETMGQMQQDQLFEQQKEQANSLAAQARARLNQGVVNSGFSSAGGRFLNGQAAIEGQLGESLLAGRRDIAVQAAEQNRKDQLAALQMQQAIANGDENAALNIYRANQQERQLLEQFLQQAAAMNSGNQLQFNSQNLASAVADNNAMMDFYRFLEMQRQFENNYALRALDYY